MSERPTPATDPVDSSNVADFFTHENEKDESKSVDWFQRMTGNEKPAPPPKFEEEVETNSASMVDSGQESEQDPAPGEEGDPGETGDPGDAPGDEPASTDPESSDDLPSVAREKERADLLGRQLAQAWWMLAQQAAQAQEAASDPEPPRWSHLTPQQREKLEAEAAELQEDPYALLTERRAEWKARQVLAGHLQQESASQRAQQQQVWEDTARRVIASADRFEEHADHVLTQLESFPEIFEVARQLNPQAMERTLTRFMNGLAAEAKLAKMEARESAVVSSAKREGREEAHAGKVARTQTSRTQAGRAKSVTPNLAQATPSEPQTTTGYIRQLAASRASSTWE